MALRQKTDRARGDSGGVAVLGEANRRARLLHGHIPTKNGCFARAEAAEHGWREVWRIGKIDHADERFHLRTDGQSNRGPGRPHTIGRVVDDAGHFRSGEAGLTVNRARPRIASDWLTDLTGYASKCRNRIRKRRRGVFNSGTRGG